MNYKIMITGAAGSGTSSLGKALSGILNIKHFEADDYLWIKTSPPFKIKREFNSKISLAYNNLIKETDFILSGSVESWGIKISELFNLVIYLDIKKDIRIERIRKRDVTKYGKVNEDFISWAAQYDTGELAGRSKERHIKWLKNLKCKILYFNNDTIKNYLEIILKELNIKQHSLS